MKTYHFSKLGDYGWASYVKGDNIRIAKHAFAFAEPEHGHDYYEIEYVCEGAGVQVINGVSHPVETGSIIVLAPGDTHSYYSLDNMAVYNCCFQSSEDLRYYDDTFRATAIQLDSYFRLQVEQLLFLLESELLNKRVNYLEASRGYLDLILLNISRNISNQRFSDPIWGKLQAYIPTHLDSITLETAAQLMGVSVSYFCRTFKKHFGVTFHHYVKMIRIQLAKNQLTFTEKSIAEICSSVGYNNACSFFQDFRECVGTTPKVYRTQSRHRNEF